MLEEMCTSIRVARGEVLLKDVETANRIYFVEKGLLFGRVNRDGRDVVNWFADEGDFVTLQQELEVVKDYLSLQRIRFEERLDVTFSIDPRTLQLFLPNMMLQTLVENAVKFGIGREVGKCLIRIVSRHDQMLFKLSVSNCGRLEEDKARKGFGLSSTKGRLELLYGNTATFSIRETAGHMVEALEVMPVDAKEAGKSRTA